MAFDKFAFFKSIEQATELTNIQRLILLSIANQTDGNGQNARISQQRIAERIGLKNPDTVRKHIKVLIATGWIIQQSKGNSMTHVCSVYRLKGTAPTEGEHKPSKAAGTKSHRNTRVEPADPPAWKPEAPVHALEAIPCRICAKPVTADDAYNPPDTPNVWHRSCFRDRYPTLTMKPEDCHL